MRGRDGLLLSRASERGEGMVGYKAEGWMGAGHCLLSFYGN